LPFTLIEPSSLTTWALPMIYPMITHKFFSTSISVLEKSLLKKYHLPSLGVLLFLLYVAIPYTTKSIYQSMPFDPAIAYRRGDLRYRVSFSAFYISNRWLYFKDDRQCQFRIDRGNWSLYIFIKFFEFSTWTRGTMQLLYSYIMGKAIKRKTVPICSGHPTRLIKGLVGTVKPHQLV
jgi:hypothetical protein